MQNKVACLVYLHRFCLAICCDTLKAFRIAQFSKNSKIQKITVKIFFFQNFDNGFLLIGVFRVFSRSFIVKLAETKISIFFESSYFIANISACRVALLIFLLVKLSYVPKYLHCFILYLISTQRHIQRVHRSGEVGQCRLHPPSAIK